MNRIAAVALAFLLASCTSLRVTSPDAWHFGIVGDTPYNDAEEVKWLELIGLINAAPLDFTVHIGDIKGGGKCSDEFYAFRLAQLNTFAQPLIYTPGDNEWTDCRRPYMGSMDPIERLAHLRKVFFADNLSLGAKRLATEAQEQCLAPPVEGCGCGALPENRSWQHRNIRFITLNVPGSNNNIGFDAANDNEARCRDAGNARWLERAVAAAQSPETKALVIALQADPWDRNSPKAYRDLLARVDAAATALRKPVLFVHGDSHTYRVDFPFASDGITRVETFGSPFVGWVEVTVDPSDPKLFSFKPHLHAFVTAR